MIRIMDKIWIQNGLDLRLKPYQVLATGDDMGMVEVVLESETTATINREAGGVTKVLSDDVLTKWLKKSNSTDEKMQTAIDVSFD